MHGSAVFAEEHDFQIDPRDTQSAEEKRENSGTPWKEKNRERVKEGMRIRIADYGETEEEREEEAEGEGDKSGYMDAKERRIYRQRGRERGKTWSSKRQSSIPRRRAPVYPAICI